jgi:hypothetical protein
MSDKKDRKPWWILSIRQRKLLSRKFKSTETAIQDCKDKGDWACVRRLRSLLRRAWWGIKRYKDK